MEQYFKKDKLRMSQDLRKQLATCAPVLSVLKLLIHIWMKPSKRKCESKKADMLSIFICFIQKQSTKLTIFI